MQQSVSTHSPDEPLNRDKRAWVYQLKKQVDERGADKASWYVGWTGPDGKLRCKSCGPDKVGKSAANRLADTTHSELVTGTYQAKTKKTWADFRKEYETKIVNRFDGPSRQAITDTLNMFERVAKPKLVASITTDMIDVSDRSQSRRHIPCAVHRIPLRITVSRTAHGVCLLLLSDTS